MNLLDIPGGGIVLPKVRIERGKSLNIKQSIHMVVCPAHEYEIENTSRF